MSSLTTNSLSATGQMAFVPTPGGSSKDTGGSELLATAGVAGAAGAADAAGALGADGAGAVAQPAKTAAARTMVRRFMGSAA